MKLFVIIVTKMESSPFLGVEIIQFLLLFVKYITNKNIVKYEISSCSRNKNLGGQINERFRDTC